jgi:tRNA-Thr(GGU) m(6)t(6)A37 methyltransferase TsaA
MHVKRSLEVPEQPMEDLPGVSVRWLWSANDGAPNFALRLFEVEPGASTPLHSHAHEHEVFILEGQALLQGKSKEHLLHSGDTALILPFDEHQFHNPGTKSLRFLCSIPLLEEKSELSAKISLHTLQQQNPAHAMEEMLEIFRQDGLEVTPGAREAMISGSGTRLFKSVQHAFENAAQEREVVMEAIFSNVWPVPGEAETDCTCFKAIGYVENEFDEPTSPYIMRDSASRIIIDAELSDGLIGLNSGDKVLVVFAFHRSKGFNLLQHPRGDPKRTMRGLFTLRSPNRPNPIGITETELLSIEGNVLTVHGLDALNGSPILDLKPA